MNDAKGAGGRTRVHAAMTYFRCDGLDPPPTQQFASARNKPLAPVFAASTQLQRAKGVLVKKPSFPPPAPICVPCRLAAIGAVVVAMAGGFAYVAGWLTPQRLTTHRIISAFETDNGPHPGFRRNHAKGVCVSGYFDSNGNAAALSSAGVFAAGQTPVIGRF